MADGFLFEDLFLLIENFFEIVLLTAMTGAQLVRIVGKGARLNSSLASITSLYTCPLA